MNQSTAKLLRKWHAIEQAPGTYRAYKRSWVKLSPKARAVLRKEMKEAIPDRTGWNRHNCVGVPPCSGVDMAYPGADKTVYPDFA